MHKETGIRIFDYTDYRRYLSDYYACQKRMNKAFSYRFFAKRAGFSSPAFYKELVDGKRGLSRTLILRFSGALKHTKRESEYFESMVYFNDAQSMEERKLYFRRMMAAHESKAYKLHADQYEYFSEWYFVAVREILSYFPFTDDYNKLATAIRPSIRPDQAQKAIRTLERLGLIAKNKNGFYKSTENTITTGYPGEDTKVTGVNLVNFQKAMSGIADQAYDLFPWSKLDMSTLTMSVSEETFKSIKEEIGAFRKKIQSMVENDPKPDRVYQLQYRFFPLTKIAEEK